MKTYRAFFEKREEAAFISHLDLQRVVMRAMKKAAVPAWYTEGFHPHISLTFALPLSLGQESLCETFDFKCESDLDGGAVCDALNHGLPQGIKVLRVEEAVQKPTEIASADYKITYSEDKEKAAFALQSLAMLEQAIVYKTNKKKIRIAIDVKEHIESLRVEIEPSQTRVFVRLPIGGEFTVNPDLLTGFLSENYGLQKNHETILRTAIYTRDGRIFS